MQQRIAHWSGPAGQHVLEMASRPLGALAPHEVLVKVLATSLNYRDLLVRATPAEAGAAPVVPLSDGSGIVVDTGSAVRRWKVGDRVTPGFFRDWHDGPYRLPYLASARGGPGVDGMLVDLMVAGENELVATPAHLSAAEAATLPCAWLTAWHALFERGQLAAGETVLVQGTGGVAMAALQLAVAHGARVLVLSRSESKCARARAMGAWQTIHTAAFPAWDQEVLRLTDGLGVDHIVELGGPDTYPMSLQAIGAGGRIAQIGVLSGFDARPPMTAMQFKNASVHGICVGSLAHFARMNTFLEQHDIHPLIEHRFGLDQAQEAFAALSQANHVGKLVIEMSGQSGE